MIRCFFVCLKKPGRTHKIVEGPGHTPSGTTTGAHMFRENKKIFCNWRIINILCHTAAFELFAASAGTGIVAPYLGIVAPERLGLDHLTIAVIPSSAVFFET
jgi:hypothetical protein